MRRYKGPYYKTHKTIIRTIVAILILLIPLWSFLFWLAQSKKPINILIVDKTVPFLKRNEHRAFNWILTRYKYVQPDNRLYKEDKDYMGFFPYKEKNVSHLSYLIKDLEKYNDIQLDSIANALDMIYYTDTYGVFYNEWYWHKNIAEHSGRVYGGLTNKDCDLLQKMKDRKKLILTEFNFFASPTRYEVRKKAQDLFDLNWSGWTGRYFTDLDSDRIENPELPRWVVNLYLKQHNNNWNFINSGIVLHNEDDRLEILENKKDLTAETPYIFPNPYAKKKYHLPDSMYFSYWFDITYPGQEKRNKVIANYRIFTTKRGDSLLNNLHLSKTFPCIFEHIQPGDYPFYYFAGDMADNPIKNLSCYFSGIEYVSFLLYSKESNQRSEYFYKFYYPLIKTIMNDYYSRLKNHKS